MEEIYDPSEIYNDKLLTDVDIKDDVMMCDEEEETQIEERFSRTDASEKEEKKSSVMERLSPRLVKLQ